MTQEQKEHAIIGWKKGAGGGGAVEEANTLRSRAYARVLDLVGEGEIEGLVNGHRSIYLDETPLQNADGTYNFDCAVNYRLGTQGQSHIPGFEAIENEVGVGTTVRKDSPVVRSVPNTNIDAVRVRVSVPALTRQDTTNGNLHGNTVELKIEVQYGNSGVWEHVLQDKIEGKTTSSYERTYRVDFDQARKSSRQIRVSRLTEDSTKASESNELTFASFTEIIDSKLSYPNSAIFGLVVEATQFDSVPSRAYHLRLLRIRVPSNYDPVARTYKGSWDGSFKIAWTNNPAWCFYDIVTSNRYGLGDLIPPGMVDKWSLYTIAKYCDELVPDGKGGMEPRYTFNTYIQSRVQAARLVQDMATAFGGIVFYAGGGLVALQDRPAEPSYLFTNANVTNGEFSYASSSKRARHTVALVTWNDLSDLGRAKIEYVEDVDGVAKYGVTQTEVAAFGCTSAGQAHRFGRSILAAELLLTETVTFKVGLEGVALGPGMVIKVRDNYRHGGKRLGGRVRSLEGKDVVTLDYDVEVSSGGGTPEVSIITAGGKVHTSKALVISGSKNRIRLLTPFGDDTIVTGATWVMTLPGEAEPALYRVVAVSQSSDGYSVTALQYDAAKYLYTDDISSTTVGQAEGAGLQSGAAALNAPPLQPNNLSCVVVDGMVGSRQTFSIETSWSAAAGSATRWEVEHRPANGNPVTLTTTTPSITLADVGAGEHEVQVRAMNARGVKSAWSTAGKLQVGQSAIFAPDGENVFGSAIARGAFLSIELSWTLRADAALRCRTVEVYGRKPGMVDYAVIARVSGEQTSYSHQGLQPGEAWTYKLLAIDQFGNESPRFPSNDSLGGKASTDVTEMLNLLSDSFKETGFYKVLDGGIEQLETQVGGIGTRFEDVRSQLEGLSTDLGDLGTQFEDLHASAEAVVQMQEVIDRVRKDIRRADDLMLRQVIADEEVRNELTGAIVNVTDQIRSYQDAITTEVARVQQLLGKQITDSGAALEALLREEERVRLSKDEALSALLATTQAKLEKDDLAISALVAAEQQARVKADEAIAANLVVLEAAMGADVKAQVLAEQTARTTADEAISRSVTALETSMQGKINTTNAAVAAEQTARATGDEAVAKSVTNLQASLQGKIDAANAAISTEATTRATEDDAISKSVTALGSSMQGKLDTTNANLATEATTRATRDDAIAKSVTTLETSVQGKLNTTNAAIATEASTRATQDEAITRSVTALETSLQGKINTANAAIASEASTRATQDEAIAKNVTALEASLQGKINTTNAAVATETAARVSGDEAVAKSVTNLQASLQGKIDTTNAALATEQTTRASEDLAIAKSVTTLEASMQGKLNAAIGAEQTARTTGDEAVARSVTALETSMQGKLNAAISTEQNARVTGDDAVAKTVTALGASMQGKLDAAILTEQNARTAGDSAVAQTVTALETSMQGKLNAAIATEQKARSDADGANATSIQQVTARLDKAGGAGVTLEQKFVATASQLGQLEGQYTVKIDSNGHVSGFGLATTGTQSPSSTFAVNADRFVITGPSAGAAVTPFQVLPYGQNINGKYTPPGVYMNDAYMKNGFITSAKIGHLAVETLSIADRAVTTMSTVYGSPSNAQTLINGGVYASWGGDWRRKHIMRSEIVTNPGSETIVIWVRLPQFISGQTYYDGSGGVGGSAASGWGMELYRDQIKVFTQYFPAFPGGLDDRNQQVIPQGDFATWTIDQPAAGYHVYDLVLLGPWSEPASQKFSYAGPPSVTMLNAKK